MIAKLHNQTDDYLFLRTRAAQLLDEGLEQQALRLLKRIDQAQLRMNKQSLQQLEKACHQ